MFAVMTNLANQFVGIERTKAKARFEQERGYIYTTNWSAHNFYSISRTFLTSSIFSTFEWTFFSMFR